MKKILLWLTICLIAFSMVATLSLAGCKTTTEETAAETTTAENTATETTVAETTAAAEEIIINVWKGPNTDHDPEIFAPVIAAFEADHPGVKVVITPTPWDTIAEKYSTAFASGNPPDVIYSFTGGYVDAVVPSCYDLKEIYSEEDFAFMTTGVSDSLMLEGTLNDGKLIGIPCYGGGATLVWNIDLLTQAGFTKPPDTLEELREYAKALTKTEGGKVVQYGWGELSPDTAEQKPEHFLYEYGVTLLNETLDGIGYDNEEGLNAFKFIDTLWNVDKTAVPIGLYPGTTMYDAFFDGKYAMIQAPGQISTFIPEGKTFNMMAAAMPKGPGVNLAEGRGTYAGSAMWSIAEQTKNLEVVKEFVKLLYDPKYNVELALTFNAFPCNSKAEVGELTPFQQGMREALKYGVSYRFSPVINEVKNAVWKAMEALQAGSIGPEEAWQQAVENGNAAFE